MEDRRKGGGEQTMRVAQENAGRLAKKMKREEGRIVDLTQFVGNHKGFLFRA